MADVIQHSSADVVILGMGAMSGTVAVEVTKAGYKAVGIERGPSWDYASDFYGSKYDEWGIGYMRKYDKPLSVGSNTFRNNRNQFALPIRRYTAGIAGQLISEGHGVGGMTLHYGGMMGRYAPWVYQMYSQTVNRYGLDFLNNAVPHQDVTDWPMTYDDYVPYYEEWEKMWGIVGTDQGPFMPNLTSYPLSPAPDSPVGALFRDTAQSMGYHPFYVPSALASKPFTNQYGVTVNECAYDGWCGAPCNYVCETGAKASSAWRTVPAAMQTGNLDLRTNSYIFRLDTDDTGKVTAARYYDAKGDIHVQPGKVFFNGLWGFNIVRMMLLSGIGDPYDPVTISGSLGRGTTMGVNGGHHRGVSGILDNIGGNAYPAGNAFGGGYAMLDLSDDNFDHTGLDFIGGAYVTFGNYPGGGPGNFNLYANSQMPSMIGTSFKNSLKDVFLPSKTRISATPSGMWPPTTDWFFDLDPHYTDIFGDPLPRVTLDWGFNTTKCANYLAPKYEEILTKMGASNVQMTDPVNAESHAYSWPAHIRGGARLGTDENVSVFNKWQQCWKCENLFAAGEALDPTGDNTTTGGTHPVGPTSYVAAEGIMKYLQSPGMLA